MKENSHTLGRKIAPALCLITSSILLGFSQTAEADLVDGLVNYWNFDDNLEDRAAVTLGSGSSVDDDGQFAGANGTDGIMFATGRFGSGINLNGAAAQNDGYVRVERSADTLFGANATNPTVPNTVSISAWVQVGSFDQGWQSVVSHGEGTQYRIARRAELDIAAYAGGVGEGPEGVVSIGGGSGWHHIVAISDGAAGETRLYVDGVLDSTGGAPVIDDLKTGGTLPLAIGANPDTGAQNREWSGDIDDVAFWNRVLTTDEITALHDGGLASNSLGALLFEEAGDADEDGMTDAWEIANLGAGAENDDGTTNVLFGPAGDPDADDSSNLQEFNRGTDPMDDDTDDDGVKDGSESDTGVWDGVTETGTDPRNPDSDGDGLMDGVENPDLPFVDENQTGSDPNLVDTDMDTFSDDAEVSANTDPNDELDFPGAAGLPLVDDFEDNSLNQIVWRTNTTIPAGAAAVVETAGQLSFTGRGHLYTREEFDPEVEGGLYIKGKWTFNSADDFLQILTRSDATPDAAAGETQAGVEFFASQIDNTVGIRVRGGEFTLDGNQRSGDMSLVNGTTYEFFAIDDGAGNLGFCIWEMGNRANAAGVTDTLTTAAASRNHVVIHNREGARTSFLEEVEIAVLADSDSDGMPDFWETDNGLIVGTNDAGADPEPDGLTNLEEFLACLDPANADTDGDGLLDGEENNSGTFTSLTDTGTDPLDPDTDDDGLLDKVETNTGIFVDATDTGSDPFLLDTDGDGTADGPEVSGGRNPVDPNDAPVGLSAGLVNYWTMDNNSLIDEAHVNGLGESSVDDSAVFAGANGTDGIAFSAGLFDGGIEQDGAAGAAQNNGFVEVTRSDDTLFGANVTNAAAPNTVTTSVWVKIGGDDTSWQTVLSHGEGTQYRIAMRGGTNVPGYAGGVGEGPDNGPDIGDGEWHHVLAISDGIAGSTTLYVDGVITSETGAPVINDAQGGGALNFNIGANPDTGAQNREWFGELDDVAQWNRALTADEVGEIYQGGIDGSSLKALLGGGGENKFRITDISYDPDTDEFSLTFPSKEGESYIIRISPDLTQWANDLDDGYPADAGQDFTVFTFARSRLVQQVGNPLPTEYFFRVEEN